MIEQVKGTDVEMVGVIVPNVGESTANLALILGSTAAAGLLAVIAGSTWGFIELKTAWISQPKITISFITWATLLMPPA